MTISAVAKIYGRMIILNNRTFESVPDVKKAEVAAYLIQEGREDLITDPSYLPVEEDTETDTTETEDQLQ